MILAAGQGRRLGKMAATVPKPLVLARGKPMIEHALTTLQRAGIKFCVINLHHLGKQIQRHVGDGRAWGMKVVYSWETRPLGTGGGVKRALPILGPDPFLLVNADLLHDVDLRAFILFNRRRLKEGHLLLWRADQSRDGDFALRGRCPVAGRSHTFCGISLLRGTLLRYERRAVFPLLDCLHHALARRRLTAETHRGDWLDLGTPQGLEMAEHRRM